VVECQLALELKDVSLMVNEQSYLKDISLRFEPGSFNVLLGRTLAGKTSVLRVLAGLDKPSRGQVFYNEHDVTGVAVQKRGLSMVYQQFINYPHLTVWENIASPLQLAKVSAGEITNRVKHIADMLHIGEYLQRLPLELSGGQQQRCAMARALVKDAAIVLFDEPLVNLDYKLREELRSELKALFKTRETIAIYATTEAHEALALGGTTTLLHQGKVLQTGEAQQQFAKPIDLFAADLYNEPPLNVFSASVDKGVLQIQRPINLANIAHLNNLPNGQYQFAIRPNHISLKRNGTANIVLKAKVDLAEISASETYLHIDASVDLGQTILSWTVHILTIMNFRSGSDIDIFLPLEDIFVFDLTGNAIRWPDTFSEETM
jgi:glycerol transport system ATP-binding protein